MSSSPAAQEEDVIHLNMSARSNSTSELPQLGLDKSSHMHDLHSTYPCESPYAPAGDCVVSVVSLFTGVAGAPR